MSKDPATETHKKLISLKHEPQIAQKVIIMQQEGGRVVCKKTRQSVRTADRRLCALSLTLAGPRASSVDFSYNTGSLAFISSQLNNGMTSASQQCVCFRTPCRALRRGRDRCQSIWRKIHSRRCCFPFDSWSENTTKSTTLGHYYRARSSLFWQGRCVSAARTVYVAYYSTCSLLSDLSNLSNQDLNKENGNLQKKPNVWIYWLSWIKEEVIIAVNTQSRYACMLRVCIK